MSVSAQEYLDFENRQPFSPEILEKISRVVINVQTRPEFGILVASGFEPYGLTVDEVRAKTESEMIRLSMKALPQYVLGNKYMVGYDCWGKDIDGVDGGRIYLEIHEFDFNGTVPTERLISNLSLAHGHFHIPGIQRVRIRGSFTGQGEVGNFEDSELDHVSLRIRSEVVQFGEGTIEGFRDFVATGLLKDNARIVFDYVDGSVREFDLYGKPIDGDSHEVVVASLAITFDSTGRTIKITGEPNTTYVVEESHDPAQSVWDIWRLLKTNDTGIASAPDDRPLESCFFKVR